MVPNSNNKFYRDSIANNSGRFSALDNFDPQEYFSREVVEEYDELEITVRGEIQYISVDFVNFCFQPNGEKIRVLNIDKTLLKIKELSSKKEKESDDDYSSQRAPLNNLRSNSSVYADENKNCCRLFLEPEPDIQRRRLKNAVTNQLNFNLILNLNKFKFYLKKSDV